MTSVWKRLQRVNKRAAKFQYTASYHKIDLETTAKWRPSKLCIVWTRRSRRMVSEPQEWEPSLKDPLKGSVVYPVPENQTITVTLFRDPRTNELEDKEWNFVLEDISASGRHRRIATAPLDLRLFASLSPNRRSLRLSLNLNNKHIVSATIHFTLHSVLLREGNATDEDMQSLASLFSVNNNSDIAVLDDLEEDDYTLSDHSSKQMSELRSRMEALTHSLNGSDAETPASIKSTVFDHCKTPTASDNTKDWNLDLTEDHDLHLDGLDKLDLYIPDTPTTPKQHSFTSKPITNQNDDTFNKSFDFQSNKQEKLKTNFTPIAVTKVNLKPLDLKFNLNELGLDQFDRGKIEKPVDDSFGSNDMEIVTPVIEYESPLSRMDREKTPGQDLLEWCQSIVSQYGCKVNDLSLSWRSGKAFCAIIRHFRPDLIDESLLSDDCEITSRIRACVSASMCLALPPIISVQDVHSDRPPDRLTIMTYLYQLRAHFTGNELQVEQLGNNESESSYMVGRHDTDDVISPELFSREILTRRSRQILRHKPKPSSHESTPESIDDSPKAILDKLIAASKESKNRVKSFSQHTSPTVNNIPPKPERLMTRKELTDPFGSDDEDTNENKLNGDSNVTTQNSSTISSPNLQSPLEKITPIELPKPTPQLLSRHDELKERARLLLGSKKEVDCPNGDSTPNADSNDEDRQAMLRERARKLIADARAGVLSPTSPTSPQRVSRSGTLEIINKQTIMDEIAIQRRHSIESDKSETSSDSDQSRVRSDAEILLERLSPQPGDNYDDDDDKESYIISEQKALEREQLSVDEAADALEKRLRVLMDKHQNPEEEDRLLSQWFNLVNKKNALLRRQMQLNILEQEEDLSRRCDLLARELRLSLAVEEWRKTPSQKRRERLLLQELIEAVNERDRLVQEMDEQERAIADDDAIERNLSQVEIQRKNNCILQ